MNMNSESDNNKSIGRVLAEGMVEAAKLFSKAEVERQLGLDNPFNPHVIEKEGVGFLVVKDVTIRISAITERQFRLVKLLFKPFGVVRSLDSVFEHISISKDRENEDFLDPKIGRQLRETIVKQTVKEIQRKLSAKGLKKTIKFNFKNGNIKADWWV